MNILRLKCISSPPCWELLPTSCANVGALVSLSKQESGCRSQTEVWRAYKVTMSKRSWNIADINRIYKRNCQSTLFTATANFWREIQQKGTGSREEQTPSKTAPSQRGCGEVNRIDSWASVIFNLRTSSQPTLRPYETIQQKSATSVFWRCPRSILTSPSKIYVINIKH